MNFAERLRQIRLSKNLTQTELARLADVTQVAIHGWEAGKRLPSLENTRALCMALNISADTLLDLPPILYEDIDEYEHTDGERELLRSYRALDDFGKSAVTLICHHEAERVSESARKQDDEEKRYIPLYINPAAAGVAAPIEDAEHEMILLEKGMPEDADYAVVIQGDSMKPYIGDGDTVFVKASDEVQIGDIGIFSVNGAIVCKMFYKSGLGDIRLISTNPDRADANVNIMRDSSDSFKCLGKVLLTKKKVRIPDYFMETL